MDLLNALKGAAGSGGLQQLGNQFALDTADVEKVLGGVLPALGGGQQAQALAGDGGDLKSMLGSMLDRDGDGSAIDDVLDMAKRFF